MTPQGGFPLSRPTAKFLQRGSGKAIADCKPHKVVIRGLKETPDTLGVRSRLKAALLANRIGRREINIDTAPKLLLLERVKREESMWFHLQTAQVEALHRLLLLFGEEKLSM